MTVSFREFIKVMILVCFCRKALQSGLYSLDMMDSVLGRITEIATGRSKGGKWVDLEHSAVGLHSLVLTWNLVLMEGSDNKVSKLGTLVTRARRATVALGATYTVHNEVIKLLSCVITTYLSRFRVSGLNVDFKRMLKHSETLVQKWTTTVLWIALTHPRDSKEPKKYETFRNTWMTVNNQSFRVLWSTRVTVSNQRIVRRPETLAWRQTTKELWNNLKHTRDSKELGSELKNLRDSISQRVVKRSSNT